MYPDILIIADNAGAALHHVRPYIESDTPKLIVQERSPQIDHED